MAEEHNGGREFLRLKGPAWGASYLVNGDHSGLTPEERAQLDAWCKREGVIDIIDIEGEAFFSWSCRLHFPEGYYSGGELVDYVAIVR